MSAEALKKNFILFAVMLVLMDRAGNGLRELIFVWATTVVLGGLVSNLKEKDFLISSAILLIEGPRFISIVREHISERGTSTAGPLINDIIPEVRWSKLLERNPFELVFELLRICIGRPISKIAEKLVNLVRMLLAIACVALSVYRLYTRDYGDDPKNKKWALNIFYVLSLAYALLYLLQKACWCCNIRKRCLFEQLTKEFCLDPCNVNEVRMIRRYFDAIYSRCTKKSILDGLNLDLVSYCVELLQSSDCEERQWGARVLHKLAKAERFADEKRRAMETMKSTIKCLQEVVEITQTTIKVIEDVLGKLMNCHLHCHPHHEQDCPLHCNPHHEQDCPLHCHCDDQHDCICV